MTVLRDHLDHSYRHLEATLPAWRALEALAGHRYAIVQHDGAIVGIITRDHLADSADKGASSLIDPLVALEPAILVPADWTVTRLVESDAVTLMDLSNSVIVLVDEERPVGVVSLNRIRAAVAADSQGVSTRPLGDGDSTADATLAGDVGIGRARLLCHEPGCGFVNTLTFFDRLRPPDCANPARPPHRLRLGL
jgi:CBS domain-containing protein